MNNSYLSLYINMCWRQTYLVAGYAVCTLAYDHICWWWCTFVAGASIDWNYKIPQAKDLFQSILVFSKTNLRVLKNRSKQIWRELPNSIEEYVILKEDLITVNWFYGVSNCCLSYYINFYTIYHFNWQIHNYFIFQEELEKYIFTCYTKASRIIIII